MTISELICRLQSIKCEHGDLRVYHESVYATSTPFVKVENVYDEKVLVISPAYKSNPK